MSVRDLEIELARWRGDRVTGESGARRLSVEDALAYRDSGNLPDDLGRSLRLVLEVVPGEPLEERRLRWEPDFHEAPEWRRAGSVPVNVVPLRDPATPAPAGSAWWEDDEMAAMEEEWQRAGGVYGLRIPGAYRSFVFKTIASLQRAGRPITVDTVAGSIARWLHPTQVAEVRAALEEANG